MTADWPGPAPESPSADEPDSGSVPRVGAGMLALVALLATLVGAAMGGGIVAAVSDNTTTKQTSPHLTLSAPAATTLPAPQPKGSVAAIAAAVLPSVVSITESTASERGEGSGIILTRSGYILTNNHVVSAVADGTGSLSVQLYQQPRTLITGHIVGRDTQSDLAVVKIDNVSGLRPATLGRSASLVVGDPVIAIGSPLGLAGTVTTGIVSALDRPVQASGEGSDSNAVIDAIQTDAAINPGNSGGPLVDGRTGEVVGIDAAIATLGSDSSPFGSGQSGSIGLGFAIPVDYARSIAQQLIRTGHATHPVIGVRAMTVSAAQSREAGALVDSVVKGGPAARAGIRAGDLVVAVGSAPVTSADDLVVQVRKHLVGDVISVTFLRGGHRHTVQVRLGSDVQVGG